MVTTTPTTTDINAYRTQVQSLTTPPTVTPTMPVVPVTPTPKVATASSYVVKSGDSLSKIASQNRMSLSQLLALNPSYKANPNLVKIGANLVLQGTSSPALPNNNPNPNPNPAPVVDPAVQANNDLAKKAGEAGLSVADYQNLSKQQNAVTKEESDAIAKELGIPLVEGELFKKPSQTSQELYQSAYNTAGLADIKLKVNALNDEINAERAQLAEAVGKIDENPFLTESSRVGRGRRIADLAEKKINNKLLQVQQYQDLYNQGINEINGIVARTQADFQTNQTTASAQLNYLQKKAEQQVAQLGDTKMSKASGSLGAYLDGTASNKKPETIGNSESGFFKYDPVTKKFVQVVAPSALTVAQTKKANADANNVGNDSGNTFKPTSEQKSLVGRFVNSSASAELGFTDADKSRLNTDPNFFYWALQKANEAGIY